MDQGTWGPGAREKKTRSVGPPRAGKVVRSREQVTVGRGDRRKTSHFPVSTESLNELPGNSRLGWRAGQILSKFSLDRLKTLPS